MMNFQLWQKSSLTCFYKCDDHHDIIIIIVVISQFVVCCWCFVCLFFALTTADSMCRRDRQHRQLSPATKYDATSPASVPLSHQQPPLPVYDNRPKFAALHSRVMTASQFTGKIVKQVPSKATHSSVRSNPKQY